MTASGNWLFGSGIQQIVCLETRDWPEVKGHCQWRGSWGWRAQMEAQSCLYSWKIHAWCWGGSRQSCCLGWTAFIFHETHSLSAQPCATTGASPDWAQHPGLQPPFSLWHLMVSTAGLELAEPRLTCPPIRCPGRNRGSGGEFLELLGSG